MKRLSAGVVLGDRGERGLRLPGHVGVGVASAAIEDLDDPEAGDALLMIASSSALRACYVDTVTTIEGPLAEAITERCRGIEHLPAQVLSASIGAATKVALRQWLRSTSAMPSVPGFVVPSGSLPDLLRAALTPLGPALDAAATRSRHFT